MYAAPIQVSAPTCMFHKSYLSAKRSTNIYLYPTKHAIRQNVSLTGAKQKIFRF